jgi:hypothetical protein
MGPNSHSQDGESIPLMVDPVNSLVDCVLYLPAQQARDHGRTPAPLDILTNGRAIISLIAELGIAVDIVHQGRLGGDVVDLAGRDLDTDR